MPSRRRRFRARPKPQPKKPKSNVEISALEVRLVGVDGQQLGVVSTKEAQERAEEEGTDLVLVADKADPPVARLMDLGKHMYEQRKKQAKQKTKSKGGEIKGVRISFKIGDHDLQIRLRKATAFLDEGNKVKVEMRLRGREKGRVDMAQQKIRDFVAAIPGGAEIEGGISKSPRELSAVVTRSRSTKGKKEEES
jgi:translation initiation factor IF-3